jgi:hypothetical protein
VTVQSDSSGDQSFGVNQGGDRDWRP